MINFSLKVCIWGTSFWVPTTMPFPIFHSRIFHVTSDLCSSLILTPNRTNTLCNCFNLFSVFGNYLMVIHGKIAIGYPKLWGDFSRSFEAFSILIFNCEFENLIFPFFESSSSRMSIRFLKLIVKQTSKVVTCRLHDVVVYVDGSEKQRKNWRFSLRQSWKHTSKLAGLRFPSCC